MSNERLYRSLYAKSLRYLGMRLRSEQEVRDKLQVWIEQIEQYGKLREADKSMDAEVVMVDYVDRAERTTNVVNGTLIDQVVDQLKRERFLDDVRFAREWTVSRLKRGKRGPAVIKMELRHKGITDEVIAQVLVEVEEEEVGISEEAGARQAAEKYLRKLAGRDEREQKAKLFGYLRSKGFSSSVVSSLVKELFSPK